MMKRPYLLIAAACVIFAAPAPMAAKETWTSVRSQNFHLVGNASEKDVRQVATRLEQFRLAFSRIFKRARLQDSVPTTVIVFKDEGSYKPFNPSRNAGYFQPGEDVNYITLSTGMRGAADNPYAVIFHEYVHLLVKNNVSPDAPAWINEGLAEFYSNLEVAKDGRAADIGKPISHHILYLREQKLLPLRTLFAVDHSSPHYNEQSKRGVFYAQSWALVHYLMFGQMGKRQPQINRYIELIGNGANQQQSFETAFGADIEVIEKELREYIRRDKYPYINFPFEPKLDTEVAVESTTLTEAQGLAYLGDLALHTRLPEQAETQLQKAVALDASNAMTQASLGMLRMRQRRFAEAKDHLRRAVSADAQNHLAHYYYAYTLSREGMSEMGYVRAYAPEAAAEMRATLKKAISLKPDYAGSYSLLAFINMVTGEQIDESIELLKRALTLAPGEERFRLDLAQLYLRKQDFDSARKLVEPLAQNSPDPQIKTNAESLLKSVNSFQEEMAKFKSAREADDIVRPGSRNEPPRFSKQGETNRAEEAGSTTVIDAAGMTPEEAIARAMREAMRKPQAGEMRARGVLMRIECNAKGATFHIRVGEQLLKLFGGDMKDIHFMAFTQQEAGGEISCGVRKPESQVVVTYRVRDKGGDLVAVEFVPANFTLEK
ncbi:MAG TPA: tetratricopeptide repeat protein [Pyrinomonadaceae bacterium]|nr:tetratricopeptide repeat protein [Pyrinomonadaceae bacterium]